MVDTEFLVEVILFCQVHVLGDFFQLFHLTLCKYFNIFSTFSVLGTKGAHLAFKLAAYPFVVIAGSRFEKYVEVKVWKSYQLAFHNNYERITD